MLFHLSGNFVRHICALLERRLGLASEMPNNKDMSTHVDCDTDNPHSTSKDELSMENVLADVGESTGEKEDESFASGINSLTKSRLSLYYFLLDDKVTRFLSKSLKAYM